MGQAQASSTPDSTTADSAVAGCADGATRYAELNTSDLCALVIERNIPTTSDCTGLGNLDRDILINLLLSYDAGVASVVSINKNCQFERKTSPICPLALSVLQKVRDAPGYMGCDIGGTLVKMVLALPHEAAESYDFPDVFGESGRAHKHLELELETSCGDRFVIRFLSGSTAQLEKAAQHLGLHRRLSQSSGCLVEMAEDQEFYMTCSPHPGGSLQRKERSLSADFMDPPSPFRRKCSNWSGGVFSSSDRPIRCMATAGGGACKFAPLFREALRVDMQPVKELSAVIDGLLFLAARSGHTDCDSTGGSPLGDTKLSSQDEQNVFTVNDDGVAVPVDWPEQLFPMILVIMGSGVSILQVNSARDGDFVRVGGTACGGGTFLGLSRVITSATSFDEALELAASGDAKSADKLVSDIYGEEGCANLGLPGNLTACNFGKLAEQECSEPDLARALLQMVTQQSALLSSAFARHAGCIDRVFFVGGFVEETNWIARKSIATNFRNLGGCAYFLRHCDFLGALGSLRCALRGIGGST